MISWGSLSKPSKNGGEDNLATATANNLLITSAYALLKLDLYLHVHSAQK